MGKETKPKTYRVSEWVAGEIERLAKKYGGVDNALRVVLGYVEVAPKAGEVVMNSPAVVERLDAVTPGTLVAGGSLTGEVTEPVVSKSQIKRLGAQGVRPFRGPLLRPGEKGKR